MDHESGNRLMLLLVLHLMIDRAITEFLTWHFNQKPLKLDDMEVEVAALPIGRRIRLMKATGLISDSTVTHITAFNKVRNRFAHGDPKHKYQLKHVDELWSQKAFLDCASKGLDAAAEIRGVLGKSLDEYSKRFTDTSASSPDPQDIKSPYTD